MEPMLLTSASPGPGVAAISRCLSLSRVDDPMTAIGDRDNSLILPASLWYDMGDTMSNASCLPYKRRHSPSRVAVPMAATLGRRSFDKPSDEVPMAPIVLCITFQRTSR